MRPIESLSILLKHYRSLDIHATDVELPDGEPGAVLLQRPNEAPPEYLPAVLEELKDVPSFGPDINTILTNTPHELFHQPGPKRQVTRLAEQVNDLGIKAAAALEIFTALVPKEDPLSINVKLPSLNSLSDLSSVVSDIHFVFDNTSRRVTGDGVAFARFDTGSDWIVLVAATKLVFAFVVALLHVAYSHAKKQAELERTQRVFDDLGDLSTELKNASAAALRSLARRWAEDLVRSHSRGDTGSGPEQIEATLAAVERLSALYLRQAEIRLALSVSNDQKKGVPTTAELKQLTALLEPDSNLLLTAGSSQEEKVVESGK